MSYIGNQPFTAAFLVDTFSGTGSQTAFTMTVAPANTSSIIVAITGVLQDPSTYSVSGTTLTFSAAPPSGTSNISVRYLGIPASGVTTTAYRTVTNTTAVANQTSFTIPSYTVGYVDVYRNGVYLPTSDYTATTGTTVVLNNAATVGDTITTVSFYVSSVLNAIPATAGSVSDSYIVSMAGSKLTGTQVVPKATLPTGSVLQVVMGTVTGSVTPTNTTYITTNLTATITPTSSTSKILVTVSGGDFDSQTAGNQIIATIYRNSTNLGGGSNNSFADCYGSSSRVITPVCLQYLDSPATTSATTYALYVRSGSSVTTAYNTQNALGVITLMEIAA
jgi:hypothetical protein